VSIISGISVAHDVASVDDIETAAATDEVARLERLQDRPAVEEAFVLQTCNRAEAYVVAEERAAGNGVLADTFPDLGPETARSLGHEDSLRHLMRVAAGLESVVLGEDQILGQVRSSCERARTVGAVGPMLEEALTKAIRVGKRARSETGINDGAVSLGSAAVELTASEYGLKEKTALVLGAGEMGRTAASAFATRQVDEIVVANRTVSRAEVVAAEVDAPARAVGLGQLPAVVADADILFSATCRQEPLVSRETLAETGSIYVIDIGQPRDVAPAVGALPTVTYRDLDSLETITDRTRESRRAAVDAVERIVDEEFDRLLEQYKRRRADDAIAAMHEEAKRLKRNEVEAALRKLEARGSVTEREREVIEALGDALVSRLLAPPTESLRTAAANDNWTTIDTALELFNPHTTMTRNQETRPRTDSEAYPVASATGTTGEDADRTQTTVDESERTTSASAPEGER